MPAVSHCWSSAIPEMSKNYRWQFPSVKIAACRLRKSLVCLPGDRVGWMGGPLISSHHNVIAGVCKYSKVQAPSTRAAVKRLILLIELRANSAVGHHFRRGMGLTSEAVGLGQSKAPSSCVPGLAAEDAGPDWCTLKHEEWRMKEDTCCWIFPSSGYRLQRRAW